MDAKGLTSGVGPAARGSSPIDYIDREYARLGAQADVHSRLGVLERRVAHVLTNLDSNKEQVESVLAGVARLQTLTGNTDESLNRLAKRANSASLIHLVAVFIVLVLLVWLVWLVLHSQNTATAVQPAVIIQASIGARQFRTGTFSSGMSECATEGDPCDAWSAVEDGSSVNMKAILQEAATQPIVILLQGGHDSEELKPRFRDEVGSNLQLAQLRADNVLSYISAWMRHSPPGNAKVISSIRGATTTTEVRKTDRTVTMTLIESVKSKDGQAEGR